MIPQDVLDFSREFRDLCNRHGMKVDDNTIWKDGQHYDVAWTWHILNELGV